MRTANKTAAALLAIVATCLLTAACSSSSTSTAVSPPPKDAAKVGVPFLAHEGKAKAEVTLIRVTYSATRPDGTQANAGEYAVLHLKIVGKSAARFKFNIESFSYQYTQQPDPYQSGDKNMTGVDPQDWMAFPHGLPPQGSVTKGKSVSGIEPLAVSPQSLLLISMSGNDGFTPIAQWLITSR